jgi:hypothetical protein
MKYAVIALLVILIFVFGYLAMNGFDRLMDHVRKSGFMRPPKDNEPPIIFTAGDNIRNPEETENKTDRQ